MTELHIQLDRDLVLIIELHTKDMNINLYESSGAVHVVLAICYMYKFKY